MESGSGLKPMHTCPEEAHGTFDPQSICTGTSEVLGASDYVIVAVMVLILAALGYGIWIAVRRRRDLYREDDDES